MTDFTGYAVACHFDTGQVDQLGTFSTDVAAKDAAITHASTWANDLGTSMAFDPAVMTARLGTGDVLEYQIAADSAPQWPVGAEPTFDCGEIMAPSQVYRTYEQTLISDGNPAMAITAVDLLVAGRLRGTELQVWCETRGRLSSSVAPVLGAALVEAINNAEVRAAAEARESL